MLPNWAGRRPAGPPIQYDISDSMHTAPGWRILGSDWYTCVKPVDAPYVDEEVIKAIQAFDPSIIVLWRRQRYLRPGRTEPETFTHLALGRHVKVPTREMVLFHVEMPEDAEHEVPNELILVWEYFGEDRYFKGGGPGGHMPCDMRLYWFLRHQFNNLRSGRTVALERERRIRDLHDRRRKQLRDELEYRQKHLDAFVMNQLDQPGDSVRGYAEYAARARAKRNEVKPRVFLKGVSQ